VKATEGGVATLDFTCPDDSIQIWKDIDVNERKIWTCDPDNGPQWEDENMQTRGFWPMCGMAYYF